MSFKRYTIQKKKKTTSPIFLRPFLTKKRLAYDVIFTDSVKYIYPINVSVGSVSRLFGLTFGILDTSAAFFGWAPFDDGIELHACVKNGDFLIKHKLIKVQTNSSYCLQIKCYNDAYTFSIFDSENIVLCYHKIKNLHSKNFGYENFIKLSDTSTVFRSVDFFLQRKY